MVPCRFCGVPSVVVVAEHDAAVTSEGARRRSTLDGRIKSIVLEIVYPGAIFPCRLIHGCEALMHLVALISTGVRVAMRGLLLIGPVDANATVRQRRDGRNWISTCTWGVYNHYRDTTAAPDACIPHALRLPVIPR